MGTPNSDTVGSILKIFSNEEDIDLLKIIANDGPNFAITRVLHYIIKMNS